MPANVVPSIRRPPRSPRRSPISTRSPHVSPRQRPRLRDAERQDREAAAVALRQGRAKIASEPATVAKARERVAAARRELDVLKLAHAAAETDLETALDDAAPAWFDELEDEENIARTRARALLAELEQTCAAIGTAASARLWLGDDGHSLDRPPRRVAAGTTAPSSARRSPNGAAFDAATIFAWAAELIDPPAAPPRVVAVAETATSDAA